MEEIWKPLVSDRHDWAGFYQVSNLGRVRRLAVRIDASNGRSWTPKQRVLKPLAQQSGYAQVWLSRPGQPAVREQVPRAVAKAFLPDYSADCVVHHRSRDVSDDSAANLACITRDQHAILDAAAPAVLDAIRAGEAGVWVPFGPSLSSS